MAELPASWNLTTRPNEKGTLDVIGKDDAGAEYRVRRTDHPELTDRDVKEIHEADREFTTSAEFVNRLTGEAARRREEQEQQFEDDLMEGAEPVVRAGLGTIRVGYSRAYARGYEEVFGR